MNERGAATVEKLMVLLMAICFIGAIVAVMGPTLVSKYQWAADLLSFGATPTIAQREALAKAEPAGVGIYVLMFVIAVVVFGGFIAPIMFPRAHRYRSELVQKFSRKSSLMTALADVSLSDEYSLEDLRAMAKTQPRYDEYEPRPGEVVAEKPKPLVNDVGERFRTGALKPDPEATVSVAEVPFEPAPVRIDPLADVRTLRGFGDDDDDEDPTTMLPPQDPSAFQTGSDDAIPFDDVPSAQQEVPVVHAGRASDDMTVRAVVNDQRISAQVPSIKAEQLAAEQRISSQLPAVNQRISTNVPAIQPSDLASSDVTEEDDVTKVAIDRPTFGVAEPDAETQAHQSLRSRLANRRTDD